MFDETKNPEATPPDSGTPAGTGETPNTPEATEEQTPQETEEQPIKILNDAGDLVKEFKNADELAKAYKNEQGKMTQALQEASTLREEKVLREKPTQTQEQMEAEKQRLESLQLDDPVAYQNEIIRKASQAAQQASFGVQKVALRNACESKHPEEFKKYAVAIDQMVNTGLAHDIMASYPEYAALGSPYEVALRFHMTPDIARKEQAKALKDVQTSNSFTPPSSSAGAGKVTDKDEDIQLTDEQTEYAVKSRPQMSKPDAIADYKKTLKAYPTKAK